MKRIVLLFALLAAAFCFADDSEYAVTVAATNSTVIISPAHRPGTWEPWTASTAVTNGTNLRSGSDYFMVLTTGTTGTNAPTKAVGLITDGTAELLYIKGRKRAIVTMEADAEVWFHTGTTASTNGGEYAFEQGQQYSSDTSDAVSVWPATAVKLNIITK